MILSAEILQMVARKLKRIPNPLYAPDPPKWARFKAARVIVSETPPTREQMEALSNGER